MGGAGAPSQTRSGCGLNATLTRARAFHLLGSAAFGEPRKPKATRVKQWWLASRVDRERTSGAKRGLRTPASRELVSRSEKPISTRTVLYGARARLSNAWPLRRDMNAAGVRRSNKTDRAGRAKARIPFCPLSSSAIARPALPPSALRGNGPVGTAPARAQARRHEPPLNQS